jgi:hypothetical protein
MPTDPTGFGNSVFLNCPYDEEYKPSLLALTFTVLECGLEPRIASDEDDSGVVRVDKIRDLIRSCRFSIHDISRMDPLRSGDLPRFNMPFELGLDLGCRFYGDGHLASKRCLILERERDRYRRALSDIAGNDIRAHDGQPEKLVSEVRKWIFMTNRRTLPSGSRIWQRFNEFTSNLQIVLERAGFTRDEIDVLEIAELIHYAKAWIAETGPASS